MDVSASHQPVGVVLVGLACLDHIEVTVPRLHQVIDDRAEENFKLTDLAFDLFDFLDHIGWANRSTPLHPSNQIGELRKDFALR